MESYAIPKKNIDEDFYKGICIIMLKHMELGEYLKNISFEGYYTRDGIRVPGVMEAYERAQNLIHIYKAEIKQHCDDIIKKCPKDFSEDEKVCLKYIVAAQATMHEMVHVQQHKFDRIESLEGKKPRAQILHKSDICSSNNIYYMFDKSERNGTVFEEEIEKSLRKVNKFLVSKYGYSVITERDAQWQSYSMLNYMLSKYADTFPHIQKYIQVNRDYFGLMGYELNNAHIESPTYSVMKFMLENDLTSDENLEWMDENPDLALRKSIKMFPNTFSRVSVGLPITPREHAEIAERCNQAPFCPCYFMVISICK